MSWLVSYPKYLRVDPYVVALVLTAGTAAVLPVSGDAADFFDGGTDVAIASLFFLYGTRLSTTAAWEGVRDWRLHGVILAATYVAFPVLGLACAFLVPGVLTEQLHAGILYLCVLPSTVQSSVTLTSVARGNVASAICAASFSNMLGVALTPLLVALLLSTNGGFSWASVLDITFLLLVPFVLGQVFRPWIGTWVREHRNVLGVLDRGVILLIVYAAFSAGTVAGLWTQVSAGQIVLLVLVDAALLACMLVLTTMAGRWLGFGPQERTVIVFSGANKSLASGLPMATVLFAGQSVSLMVLPLMLFHQLQLMVCAWLAQRFAANTHHAEKSAIPR